MKWPFWTRTQPTTPDDCHTIDPLLSLYADDMASAEEVRRVEAHLPGCAVCREALAWMQATQRALAARPVVSPPADLRARIAGAIAASSAAPLPISIGALPARAFALRPAYAAAASLTALGAVISYGLLHHPSQVAVHPVNLPTVVAVAPSANSPSPITRPLPTGPGVTPRAPRHAHIKPALSSPDLVAVKPPDEPHSVRVKKPGEIVPLTKLATESPPIVSPVKRHPALAHKPVLPKPSPAMMATLKAPVRPFEPHTLPVVKPEDKKPETVVATTRPVPTASTPALVEKRPIVTQDPPTRVAVASPHEGHFQTADLLGPVKANLGQMQSFTHATISRGAANGAGLATRSIEPGGMGYVDAIHSR